ncbi:MAG: hypothetical protein ACREA0_33875, partial [bacterium]
MALRNAPTNGKSTLTIDTHDVIVRHLRVRPGRANPGVMVDSNSAIDIGTARPGAAYNIVIDHCSATWAIDGNLDTGSEAHDFTVQWSIVSEGLNLAGHSKGAHSRAMGFYVGADDTNQDINGRISVHHNLMSHVEYRVPSIAQKFGRVEVIDNVIYHTTNQGININATAHGVAGPSKNRFINNYLLRTASPRRDLGIPDGHHPGLLVHVKGNIGPSRLTEDEPDLLTLDTRPDPGCPVCTSTSPATLHNHGTTDPLCTSSTATFPYPAIRVTEDSAPLALQMISETGAFAGEARVGATRPRRDAVDARILSQLQSYLADPSASDTIPVPG